MKNRQKYYMRNSAGIIADGDRDRDPAGKFKADYCRRQGKPGTLDTDFLTASFRPRPYSTEQRPETLRRSEKARQHDNGSVKPSSETEPEFFERTLQNNLSSARTETGAERHQETAESVKRLIQPRQRRNARRVSQRTLQGLNRHQ